MCTQSLNEWNDGMISPQEGEICVSGPCVMQGYHNLPQASAEVFFDVDGERRVFALICGTNISLI